MLSSVFGSISPVSARGITTGGSLAPEDKLSKGKQNFDQLLTIRWLHWVNEFIDTLAITYRALIIDHFGIKDIF